MSSNIEKLNTICVSCNVLLKDKNVVKNRKKVNKCPHTKENEKNHLFNVYMKTIL